MTPDSILAAIPIDLIRRHPSPTAQLENAKRLAAWLLARGIRPSLAEIEEERSRRTPTRRRSKVNRPSATPPPKKETNHE